MTSQARPTTPTATPRSPSSRLAGVLADLAAEGDALDAPRRGPRRTGLAHPDPGRGLGRRPPGRPPGVDRRGRGQRRHRQGGLGRGGPGGAGGPRRVRGRGGRARCRGRPRRACSPAGAPRARRWPTRSPRCPRGAGPLVRAADERHLDGHRPLHGDLGARARRGRGARRRRPHRPTGSGTWRTSGCVPATSPSPCTGSARRTGSSGSSWSRRAAAPGPTGPRTRRRRSGGRRTTSACSSPSAGTAPTSTWSPPGPTRTGGSTSRRRSRPAGCRPGAGPRPAARAPTDPGGNAVSAGVLRVGNCSGFYGDRLSAMREMLEGGELDVLTGDYLAELTMLILGRDRMKDPHPRLRPHLPPAGRGVHGPRARARGEDRVERRRPEPLRGSPSGCARPPPRSASRPGSPTCTATT